MLLGEEQLLGAVEWTVSMIQSLGTANPGNCVVFWTLCHTKAAFFQFIIEAVKLMAGIPKKATSGKYSPLTTQ
jgi:hypothetical protein